METRDSEGEEKLVHLFTESEGCVQDGCKLKNVTVEEANLGILENTIIKNTVFAPVNINQPNFTNLIRPVMAPRCAPTLTPLSFLYEEANSVFCCLCCYRGAEDWRTEEDVGGG